MTKFCRKSLIAVALAAGLCAAGSRSTLWADEKMAGDHMKMASEQMDKMKMMAADQAQAQQMTADMAKMMVMDHMAMQMAMDPKFKDMAMQTMNDENVKKVHDDAKAMADDPAQMAKMQQDVMADPKSMQMVMHMAAKMSMMHDAKMKEMPDEKK
jgi:hypothetical protein